VVIESKTRINWEGKNAEHVVAGSGALLQRHENTFVDSCIGKWGKKRRKKRKDRKNASIKPRGLRPGSQKTFTKTAGHVLKYDS